MNSTIYARCNQCSFTGLEREIKRLDNPDGSIVRLFVDHKGWHRIALFTDNTLDSGVSGVVVQPDGEIYYKETVKHARGNDYTRMLQIELTRAGVFWYRSPWLTEAGAACYKD